MPAKIGLSYQLPVAESQLRADIGLAPWAGVKSIDYTLPLAVARDAGVSIRVLRVFGSEGLDPVGAAALFLSKDLTAVTHLQLANESPRCGDFAWQSGVVAALRSGGYRGAFLGMGFATGNPAAELRPGDVGYPDRHIGSHFPDWLGPDMVAIAAACRQWGADCANKNGVALNQYFYCSALSADWVNDLQYRPNRAQSVNSCLFQHNLDIPDVYVTECGREVGGWQGQMSVGEFADAATFLDGMDQSNAWLKARFYFTLSPANQWVRYDYRDVLPELAEYVRDQHQQAISVVAPVSAPVVIRESIRMVNPIDFKQLSGSLDCWVECIRRFFSRYGLLFDVDTVFQAGKGYAHPAGGEAADFPTFLRAVMTLARSVGVEVGVPTTQWKTGNMYLQYIEVDDFNTLWITLQDSDKSDPWTVTIGENNADLNPAEPWQHFGELLQNPTNGDEISWYDPASTWDGDAAQYSKSQFEQAIKDNWDPKIVGYALKIKSA